MKEEKIPAPQSGSDSAGHAPFERLADKYDAWFDGEEGRRIFRVEVECIRRLLSGISRPWLEIGVGTGRFAAALGIDEGIDPSGAVLRYSARRGIRTRKGTAEALPYKSGRFGAAVLVVTICFLDDPLRAFSECRRVLLDDGCAVVGLVPKDSPWGRLYALKGKMGHPFYSAARFYTCGQVIEIAEQTGLYLNGATSCLFEHPGEKIISFKNPRDGIVRNAGFIGMRFGTHAPAEKRETGTQTTRTE